MNIAVFARPVHNQVLPLKPGDAETFEELHGYCPVPNLQDEYALEYALKLKDQHTFRITAVSMGGNACETVLREFLACGADQAVCLDGHTGEPDNSTIARRIVAYHEEHPFHLGLFGFADSDTRAGEVGPMVAALAGIPFVGPVIDLQWDGTAVLISRKLKKTTERLRLSLPACVGILRGPPLRYHSFFGRLRAEGMEIQRVYPQVSLSPRVGRIRLTQPKPQKRSLSSTGREVSSQERIEQALGLSSRHGDRESPLLTGDPADVAQKALELVRDAKILSS